MRQAENSQAQESSEQEGEKAMQSGILETPRLHPNQTPPKEASERNQ